MKLRYWRLGVENIIINMTSIKATVKFIKHPMFTGISFAVPQRIWNEMYLPIIIILFPYTVWIWLFLKAFITEKGSLSRRRTNEKLFLANLERYF